jgi:hypothetical protein
MMRGRRFDVANFSAARTAGKTFLLLEAGGSNPIVVQRSRLVAGTLATSFQLEAQWVKVATKGSPVGAGTTTVHPLDPGGTAATMTALGDLTTDATTYETDAEFIRGHDVWPSTIGWRFGSLRDEDQDDWIYIAPTELWGLQLVNSSFSLTTIAALARCIELG